MQSRQNAPAASQADTCIGEDPSSGAANFKRDPAFFVAMDPTQRLHNLLITECNLNHNRDPTIF